MNVQLPNSFFVYLVLFGGSPPLLLVYHILHDLSIDGMDKKSLADACISYADLWDTILTFSSATYKKNRTAFCLYADLRCGFFELFRAIPHKDCAADASSNFSSDETKSGVNT